MRRTDFMTAADNACHNYEKVIAELEFRLDYAKKTLLEAGYALRPDKLTWNPPLGQRPDFEVKALIDAAAYMAEAGKVFNEALDAYKNAPTNRKS